MLTRHPYSSAPLFHVTLDSIREKSFFAIKAAGRLLAADSPLWLSGTCCKREDVKMYYPAAKGWSFDGGRVEMNTEENRAQIFFDEKPDSDTRDKLKGRGFRWAPS